MAYCHDSPGDTSFLRSMANVIGIVKSFHKCHVFLAIEDYAFFNFGNYIGTLSEFILSLMAPSVPLKHLLL